MSVGLRLLDLQCVYLEYDLVGLAAAMVTTSKY
jgi:hypothetical protein